MMRYTRSFLIAFTFLPSLLIAVPQEQPTFTVLATLTRTESDGNVITESNKVELQANSKTASARTGGTIPAQLPNGLPITQTVGNQLDCILKPTADGRYLLQITVTHRSRIDEAQASLLPHRVPGIPAFRNIIYAGTLIVAEGQSVQVTGADLVNIETVQVNIALSAKQPVNGAPQIGTETQPPPIPIRTQFVLTKTEGDKETSAIYNIPTTNGITASLRIGTEVPMAANAPTAAGLPYTLQQIGTLFNQVVRRTNDGRFTVQQSVTWRLLAATGQFTTYAGRETLTLSDGEQGHFNLLAKDTGETRTIGVTVTAVK